MKPLVILALGTVLAMIPVTLLVPGLAELVMHAHGGTRAHAHAFMAVNMFAGILAVPLVMVRLRRRPGLGRWMVGLLLLDAVLFLAMGQARTLEGLLLVRTLEGAAHLPAVTLLMVAAGRLGAERRGAALGLVAGAIMIGVAIGAPLGGILVGLGPGVVYTTGAAILAVAALVVAVAAARVPAAVPHTSTVSRYHWDHRAAHAWMPLVLGFLDRFTIGVFTSTFTLYLAEVLHVTPRERGMLISLFMIPFALLCYPAGRLADRHGWLVPLLLGNFGFGVTYAFYGFTPAALLPLAMLVSGVMSALMYAPNLVLVGEMARRGAGEGMYGAFQVAGSLGFLAGPIAGGVAVEVSRRVSGGVQYAAIFAAVGLLVVAAGAASAVSLSALARRWAGERAVVAPAAPAAPPLTAP